MKIIENHEHQLCRRRPQTSCSQRSRRPRASGPEMPRSQEPGGDPIDDRIQEEKSRKAAGAQEKKIPGPEAELNAKSSRPDQRAQEPRSPGVQGCRGAGAQERRMPRRRAKELRSRRESPESPGKDKPRSPGAGPRKRTLGKLRSLGEEPKSPGGDPRPRSTAQEGSPRATRGLTMSRF